MVGDFGDFIDAGDKCDSRALIPNLCCELFFFFGLCKQNNCARTLVMCKFFFIIEKRYDSNQI